MTTLADISSTAEVAVRLACFFGVLAAMLAWEMFVPRRRLSVSRGWRWSSNLGLVALNTVLVRFAVPVTAVAAAFAARERGWGVLHLVGWPGWGEIVLAVLALDLAIYLQHVMFHAVPLLWRLHRVHHADLDFDVTTGVRFHTLEIVLSAVIKLAAVVVIGAAPVAVVIFEVLLNATSLFNHSNVRLPVQVDHWLRRLVVTPDMHRVHHSIVRRETDSNFGFNLPWWDFLMGTYRAQPQAGHEQMKIGLPSIRDERQADRLPAMLWMPFTPDRDAE
ncbi:MAG: sterol desaturase family protein [Planctomycetaceae bacterium]